MDAVKQSKAQLLPVDSEHNAIFQSLPQPIQHNLGYADLEQNGVVSILLTGSGGLSVRRHCAIGNNDAGSSLPSSELVDGA